MAITISGENNNDRILASDGVIDSLSGFNVVGVITATSFTGDLTGNVTGNVVGNLTGNVNHTSNLLLQIGGSEKFRVASSGQLGIGGANYGTSGQVLTSGGSGSAASWTTIAAQANISNNADNRVITGGSGVNLNGEATLTYNGTDTFELQPASATPAIFIGDSNRTGAGQGLAQFRGNWNGTTVARITFDAGDDTTNKDDGIIRFDTAPSGSLVERLRIDSSGRVLIGDNDVDNSWSGGDSVVIGNTSSGTRTGVTLVSANDQDGGIYFSDGTSSGSANVQGQIVYNHSNNYLSLYTTAIERLRVKSDGTISYRTGGGKGYEFNSSGSSASVAANMYAPASYTLAFGTNGNERLRIDSSGRLLKGTTSRITLANNPNTQIVGTSASDASLALIRQTNGGGEFVFAAGASGSNISSGNGLGFIKFMGYHTNGYDEYARIESYADGTTGDGDAPGRLSFKTTADGANNPTERLRITSTGTVEFYGAGGATEQIAVQSQGGGAKIYISNYQGVDAGDASGRLGVGKNDNALIYMNASGSQVQNFAIGTTDSVPLVLSTANTQRFVITGDGSIQHKSGSGVSYFNGASEYVVGSVNSSPSAGGYESKFQIQDAKTRSALTVAGYMNNAGGPFMTLLSSRSGTIGTLGTKCIASDNIGGIRFTGDNGTNYNTVALGAEISAKAASTPGDGDTIMAGRMMFNTGTANAGSSQTQMEIREDGALMLRRGRVNNNGSQLYCFGGYINGTGTLSFDIPVFTAGNIYRIDAFYSHHSLGYGAYKYGIYGAYSGHAGLQINNDIASHSSSNNGSWTITRGSAGQPIVIAKTAGTYSGGGYWFVNVYAGNYTQL